MNRHIDIHSPKRGQYVMSVQGHVVMAWTARIVKLDVSRQRRVDTEWINKMSDKLKLGVQVKRIGGVTKVTFEDAEPVAVPESGRIAYVYETGEVK